MSIRGLNYWSPVLQLEVLRGLPAPQAESISERVISFELEDHFRLNDKATLTLNNNDGLLLDTDALALGMVINVSYGYPGSMSTPRSLICKSIKGGARIGTGAKSAATKPNTAAGGIVTFELHSKIWGLDLFRARSKIGGDPGRPLTFKGHTIPEIVREIAQRHGYKGNGLLVDDMDEEATHEDYTIPAKMSSAEWVQDQARRRHWVFSIDGDGFHFHPPRTRAEDAANVEQLAWFSGDPDIIEWSVDGDLRVPQVAETVGVKDELVLAQGAVEQLQSDNADTDLASHSEPGVPATVPHSSATRAKIPVTLMTGTANSTSIAVDRLLSVPNPTRRQREQSEAMINRGINRWKLNLTLVGNPYVHARKPLHLSNFGPLVDGLWWIRKSVHTIRAGLVYQTTVECVRKSPDDAGNQRLVLGKGAVSQLAEGQDGVPTRSVIPIVLLVGT